MTDIIFNSNFVDKDKNKKQQISQEHQPSKILNSIELAQQQQQHKDEALLLENEWSFWEDHYTNNNNSVASIDEYLNALQQLCSFSNIQDFWSCFNNIPSISKLPNNSCFHLFKKGTRPIWEENQEGGEFVLKVKKFHTDEVWNELVLSVIGEQFSSYLQDNDDICGISIRKKQGMDFNMIHIWNKNSRGKEQIPRAIKHLFPLLLDECIHSYYREHVLKPNISNTSGSGSGSINNNAGAGGSINNNAGAGGSNTNRLQQLKNMNKSTSSVLKPTANAFVPRKSVRFNLSKSKSESVIPNANNNNAAALSSNGSGVNNGIVNKKVEKSALKPPLVSHSKTTPTVAVLEQSPMQVDIKPILSKRTANIPLSFDTITDLKPKEINFQKLNQKEQGIVDELENEFEKEEEIQNQKELEQMIEREIQKRRPSEQERELQQDLDEEYDDQMDEYLEDEDDEEDEESEDPQVQMERELLQKIQKEVEHEIEDEIVKKQRVNESDEEELEEQEDNDNIAEEAEATTDLPILNNGIVDNNNKGGDAMLSNEEEGEEGEEENDDDEIVPDFNSFAENDKDEVVPESQSPFNFDPVKENDKLDHLNDQFNLVNKVDKEIQQEQQLKEAKSLIDNDLKNDQNEIDWLLQKEEKEKLEKLEKEKLEKEMDEEIEDIVDQLSDSEVEEELDEEIDEWEQELGINDPDHVIRNSFKNEFKQELKDELKEDIKESVKNEVNAFVNASKLNPTVSTPPMQSSLPSNSTPLNQIRTTSSNTTPLTSTTTDINGNDLLDTLYDVPTIEEY